MTATRIVLGTVVGALLGIGGGYALWHMPAAATSIGDTAEPAAAAHAPAEPGVVELDAATVQRLGSSRASTPPMPGSAWR